MKIWILAVLLIGNLAAQAGTSVGNFNFINQPEFDFRVGYPKHWKLSRPAATDPDEVEVWRLSNQGSVSDPAKESSAEFVFLKNFPAKNDKDLLLEIKKRHPQLLWKPLANPDFSIGFVSDQVFLGPDKTQSFEYYFSESGKVVRLKNIRDSFKNGAAELDSIVSTIRRPTEYPQILSITSLDPHQKQVNVGDTFCYKIEADVRRNDFSKENLSAFEIKGAPSYWAFKSIQWNQTESAMVVCVKVTARFGLMDLRIKRLSISSELGASTECREQENQDFVCDRGTKRDVVKYQVPSVNNAKPDTRGPKINSVLIGSKSHSLKIDASDNSGLQSGIITLDSSHSESLKDAVVIYEDQLTQSPMEIEIKRSRLFSGYTRIISIKLVDKAGNISQLKAESGKVNYMLYSSGVPAVETKIPVVSVLRGAP